MPVIVLRPDQTLLISAARIWRGTPEPPEEKAFLCLQGGRIAAIGPGMSARQADGLPNDTADGKSRLLELGDCTVMPGMIDCHVHLALDGRNFNAAKRQWDNREIMLQRVTAALKAYLEQGIVAVRDGGDLAGIALAVRNQIAADKQPGPLVLAGGQALRREGKYGSFLGPGLKAPELEAAVDRLASRGVDQIKVLVSGIVSFKTYRRVGGPQFTVGELTRIVDRAHSHGLRVMAHASGDEAVQLAMQAGVDSIEHGYFAAGKTLAQMAARDIYWVPTIIPVAGQLQEGLCGQYTLAEQEVIEQTYRRQLRLLALARQLGVKTGVGTDAGATGVLHGQGYYQELMLYRKAGLSDPEILLAATATGAAVAARENELGRIAPGRPARLIAVAGDPWRDIGALKNVRYVIIPAGSSA